MNRHFFSICLLFIPLALFLSSLLLVAKERKRDIEVDSQHPFIYENFDPAPEHRPGLDIIFSGRAFRPSGVPYKIKKKLNSMAGNLALVGVHIVPNFPGRYPPSPDNRDAGFSDDQMDPGISRSIFTVGRCLLKSDRSKSIIVTLPPDSFAQHVDCSQVKPEETITVLEHNCFTCHVGFSGNHVIAGAHSNFGYQGQLFNELRDLFDLFDQEVSGRPLSQRDSLKKKFAKIIFGLSPFEEDFLSQYFDFSSRAMLQTFHYAKSIGDNIGLYTSYGGIQALNPNGEIFEIYRRNDPKAPRPGVLSTEANLPPLDANPWWNLKFKKHVFWKGEYGLGRPRQDVVRFLHGFNFQHEGMQYDHEAAVARLAKVFDYAKSLHSPKYPFPINSERVSRGRELFHTPHVEHKGEKLSCSDCHGTYTLQSSDTRNNEWRWRIKYPGRRTEIHDVGTDPEYASVTSRITTLLQPVINAALDAATAKYGKEHALNYSPRVEVAKPKGVIPPPLVGLWASPPYFHNGSVPTVYHVLKATARPAKWSRPVLNQEGFDSEKLGFAFEQSSDQPFSTYDTKDFGRSNAGHEFAKEWKDQDIFDVIEFLKSISGDLVAPDNPEQGLDLKYIE